MKRLALMLLVTGFFAFIACKPKMAASVVIDKSELELFQPLPEAMTSSANLLTEEKIALGRMLYFEPRLSRSQLLSCNSCHVLTSYGVDRQPTSGGDKGQKGTRNSPTVYNAAGHFAQFWDGRAVDVEAQAKGPILNPVEMAMPSGEQVVKVLKSMPEYVTAFRKAFPKDKNPVTYDNVALAIGAFERKLVTPSRWDSFLHGNQDALTVAEKAGFNDYMDTGCATCHAGTYLGGNQYQRIGAVKTWPDTSDLGRESVTKSEADRLVFKVPSLRNVAKTGPYFHNGKVDSLEKAITAMADYQLGKKLAPEKVESIAIFLGALSGELPLEYVEKPDLPKGSSNTPKPVLD